jgi:ABC-type transport system substrate-binding protein
MRMDRRTVPLLALALAVVLALTLGACGSKSSGSNGGGTATSTGTPVKGGKLVVTFQGDPTGLDPAIAWEVESNCIERVTYQTLLTYKDASGAEGAQLAPDLATEVPTAANGGITEGGKVYTFHIKKGMAFAPPVNRDVTAQDFKYSIERMLKEPLAPATYFYTGITGAQDFIDGKAKEVTGLKVVDPSTLQITLDTPDVSFLYSLTLTFTSAVPKEWVNQVGKQISRKPLGTGPYIVESWTPGQEIVCKPNPNWKVGKQQWLDEIDFQFSSSPSTALLKLERGEVDLLGDTVPPADYQRTKVDPTWGKYMVEAPQINSYYAFLNVEVKPFDNLKVRQAVNYAIDSTKIQKLLAGQAVAANQVYPQGMPGYEAGKQFYSYDPTKAKQLLAEAGYPNGFSTTFYTHNVDPFPKIAQAIQADLKAVGINASIKQMDRATYWTKISEQASKFPLGLTDWVMDYPDPSDWIGPLYSSASAVEGGANVSWWKNAQVDSLYKQSASELDPVKRVEMYKQMQDIIMADAPIAPLYQSVWTSMYGKTTGGFFIHPVWVFVFQDYWKTNGQ